MTNENSNMNHQSTPRLTRKFRPLARASDKTSSPAKKNLTPANTILPPVMQAEMPNSAKPNLIRGYAQPHATAAVSANRDTHTGRWNMLLLSMSQFPK